MPATKGKDECAATAAKPQRVTKTAQTITIPPASAMVIAHPRLQLLHRAGVSRQESHFRKKLIVGSLQDGQRYMRRLTFEITGLRGFLRSSGGLMG